MTAALEILINDKKGIFYTIIILIVALISSGFKPYNYQISNYLFADKNELQSYVFPSQNSIDYFKLKVPFIERYFWLQRCTGP